MTSTQPASRTMSGRYRAFLSYSHSDRDTAIAVQRGLQRLARPWYRPPAFRVFRDDTDLTATPGLWSSIEDALLDSEFFILLACPAGAASPWVDREVATWMGRKQPERLMLALTDGELAWDSAAGDFDWAKTTVLPPTIRGAFREEPRWVDLRALRASGDLSLRNQGFRDCVADLAAPLHASTKERLIGEDVRRKRQWSRLRNSVMVALTVLLAVAVAASVLFAHQRNVAEQRQRIATARQLAAISTTLTGTHLDLAQLFAVAAYRMDRNPQTRAALFQSVTSSPYLVRYLPAEGQISAIAGAANGRVAVAGTETGLVLRWDITTGARVEVGRLAGKITSVGASADGSVITATDGSAALMWKSGQAGRRVQLPVGWKAHLTAVSPSGRFVIVHYVQVGDAPPGRDMPDTASGIELLDLQSQGVVNVTVEPLTGVNFTWSNLVVPTDAELVLFDGASGAWERRAIPDMTLTSEANSVGFGAKNYANAISSSGRFFGYSNAASTVPIWQTSAPGADYDHPALIGRSSGGFPDGLAISGDGTRIAVADTGTIYVSDTVSGSAAQEAQVTQPVALGGNGTIDGVTFLGDKEHLLSASGDLLTIWDLGQLSRISERMRTTVETMCVVCEGPAVAVRPDGQSAGVVSGIGRGTLTVRELNDAGRVAVLQFDGGVGPPLWSVDGKRLFLFTGHGVEIRSADGGPVLGRWDPPPNMDQTSGGIEVVGLSRDGRRAVAVYSGGEIVIRNTSTGAVEQVLRAQVLGAPPGITENIDHQLASVNADATAVAIMAGYDPSGPGDVKLVDLRTGGVRTVAGGPATGLAFSGEHLLVQRPNGVLEVWDATGSHLQQSIPGAGGSHADSSAWGNYNLLAANPQGTLVARKGSGMVVVTDLASGEPLGTFNLATISKVGMAFAPDGRELITVTEDPGSGNNGELQRWDLSEDSWVQIACRSAGRNLTPEEWRRYVGSSAPSNLGCGTS